MRRGKKKYIVICPKCGSAYVSADFSNPALVSTGLFSNIKKCGHCGHSGIMFPQVPASQVPKKPKNPDDVKGRTLVDITFGRGETGLWKIFGPLGIIFSFLIYFYSSYPYNMIWGIVYLLPISVYTTLYAYQTKIFQESGLLRAIGIFVVLYAFVGFYLALYFSS